MGDQDKTIAFGCESPAQSRVLGISYDRVLCKSTIFGEECHIVYHPQLYITPNTYEWYEDYIYYGKGKREEPKYIDACLIYESYLKR